MGLASRFKTSWSRSPQPDYDEDKQEGSPDLYASPSPEEAERVTWTPEEERKLVLKFDLLILPLLTIAFFAMQMGRGNIGNAVVDGLFEDIHIDQAEYNVGQQLLYVGIVILELPSNLVLYRIGPRWWLGGQIIAWGLVEIFQIFMHNVGGFYTTRLLLGLCEAGFIPAGLYCLSMWYKRSETSKRFAIFYFGNLVSQGGTSLLAYGIFHMEGISGLRGWQWMFILEGLFAVCLGIIVILLLPKDPNNPYPLSGISYFTSKEHEIMWKRVVIDDSSKTKKSHSISGKELVRVLSTWRIYPHALISMCGIAPVTAWLSYAPKLVTDLGYDPLNSNALVSIGGWCQMVISLLLGILADTTRRRGFALLAGILLVWGVVIGDLVVRTDPSVKLRFGLLITTLAFSSTWQPLNGSWLSINAVSPAERTVTMAIFVMATNIGGIFGSQLFQPSAAPVYTSGWAGILSLETVALLAVIFTNIQYRLLNAKRRRSQPVAGQDVQNGKRMIYWL